ncbi:hypothetical protein PINS_up011883 [Pythium insidiosum]|nr:hypothetical protein PINS_up011883 [Pythium insidiosum]
MEIAGIEHENTILELKEKVQKLKRRVESAEEALNDKDEECKNLSIRLAVRPSSSKANERLRECTNEVVQAVESAWEAARGQNKTALNELKKKYVPLLLVLLFRSLTLTPVAYRETLSKELESIKTETKQASYRIHALDLEVETAQSKLRQKERLVDELRDANAQLKREMNKLTSQLEDLSSNVAVLQDVVSEKDKELRRKDELLRAKKTEVKCLAKIDDSSKERIEELVRQVAELQQQLLETQKDYLHKVKKDEAWREKQRAKDRAEIVREMEALHKPRRCKHCSETFTNKSNTALACSYHPGRYVARQYPLEGYHWSCCQKRDLSARACKFAGRHVESKLLD